MMVDGQISGGAGLQVRIISACDIYPAHQAFYAFVSKTYRAYRGSRASDTYYQPHGRLEAMLAVKRGTQLVAINGGLSIGGFERFWRGYITVAPV